MRVLLLEPSNLEPRRGSGAFSIPLFFFLPHPIPLFFVILVSLIAPFVLKPKKKVFIDRYFILSSIYRTTNCGADCYTRAECNTITIRPLSPFPQSLHYIYSSVCVVRSYLVYVYEP